MVTNPQNRAGMVAKLLRAHGGELLSYHLLLNGDVDFFMVSSLPQDRVEDISLINSLLVRGAGAIATGPADGRGNGL